MEFVNINLSPELDNMPKTDIFFCIAYEECFGHERCVFIENLRLQQAVEICLCLISAVVIAGFEVIRIRIINVLGVLIKDLELQEVDALLEEIYITEIFQMQYELCSCSVRHYKEIFLKFS